MHKKLINLIIRSVLFCISTLYFNFLGQRPAAIVSPIAGTTRDVIETALNIGGYPVLVNDTAGLRATSDIVEKEGVRRALERFVKHIYNIH